MVCLGKESEMAMVCPEEMEVAMVCLEEMEVAMVCLGKELEVAMVCLEERLGLPVFWQVWSTMRMVSVLVGICCQAESSSWLQQCCPYPGSWSGRGPPKL